MKQLIRLATASTLLVVGSMAQADTITFDTWTSDQNGSGNYQVTVDDNNGSGTFTVTVTVTPWNAEALGLLIDFGDFDIQTAVGLIGNDVTLEATDTSSSSCGNGCNLNGLSVPLADPDGEWELVFGLGTQGFNNIQTFTFSFSDFGLTLADWGVVGIRAQQYCGENRPETLPDDERRCEGSDKSYGFAGDTPPSQVPEPGTLALLGLGLIVIGVARRRRVA